VKPPERLLDDASIEPDLREALRVESARDVPFDVTAGLARLQAAIDAPPLPPAAEAATSTGLKLKLLLGGGAAIGAAVIGFALTRPEPAPAPVVAPREVPTPTARLERPTRVVAPPSAAPSAEPSTPAPPPPSAKISSPPVDKVDKAARIAEEIRHLGEVRQLAASNPAAAAKKADEGHARFKGGMLYQEREAVAITSLARAGRSAEARARGTRFLQVFPKSPFADQIRSATGIAP
jgi:hypothetical protein